MAMAELNEFRVQGTVTGWPRSGRFQDGTAYLEISIDNVTKQPMDGKPPLVGTFQMMVYSDDIQKYSALAPGQQVLVSGYLKTKAVTSQKSGDTYHRVILAVRNIILLPAQNASVSPPPVQPVQPVYAPPSQPPQYAPPSQPPQYAPPSQPPQYQQQWTVQQAQQPQQQPV